MRRRRSHGQQLAIATTTAGAGGGGHVAVGPAEQEVVVLGELPPQGGVVGAQQGVVAAEAGHLPVASLGGVPLPPARLPGERLGGAAAGGVGGVGLDDELAEVGHPEHQVQRPEVVHPVRREVGRQLAVGLALATLVLADGARAPAVAAAGHRPPAAVPSPAAGAHGTNKRSKRDHICIVQDCKVRGGSCHF